MYEYRNAIKTRRRKHGKAYKTSFTEYHVRKFAVYNPKRFYERDTCFEYIQNIPQGKITTQFPRRYFDELNIIHTKRFRIKRLIGKIQNMKRYDFFFIRNAANFTGNSKKRGKMPAGSPACKYYFHMRVYLEIFIRMPTAARFITRA